MSPALPLPVLQLPQRPGDILLAHEVFAHEEGVGADF